MLGFHEQIIAELLQDENGGLVVLGSGLGLNKIIASLLALHDPSQGVLFVLSASDNQRHIIKEELQTRSLPPPHEINAENAISQERVEMYGKGGSFFITSRILVVDMLNEKVPLSKVQGIMILNAHKLTETCAEAFIVRLYRFGNKNGYVRAFSDRPHAMISGFSKPERIMKSLFVKRLHLWPRFQVFVSDILERDPPEVVDIRIPLTSYMSGIQSAIVEIMDACLKELRKTNKVDVEDLTVENGLFKSFYDIVRQQLNPIWHVVGRKTKQLVNDLRTLRKLSDYLVRYDAVNYLKYLDALRVSEGVHSVWIFANPSHRIFDFAKKRVFQIMRTDGDKLTSGSVPVRAKVVESKRRKVGTDGKRLSEASMMDNSGNSGDNSTKDSSGIVLEVVGEEMPKWKILREILEEIEEERQKQKLSEGKDQIPHNSDQDGAVLVACKDERSCIQLQECITKGPQRLIKEEWERYLLGKKELHGMRTQSRSKSKNKGSKGYGILNGRIPSVPNTEQNSACTLEQDVLLAAAAEVAHPIEVIPAEADKQEPQKHAKIQGRGRGRGRAQGRGRKSTNNKALKSESHDQERQETIITDTSKDSEMSSGMHTQLMEARRELPLADVTKSACNASNGNIMSEGSEMQSELNDPPVNNASRPLPTSYFYALESEQNMLDIVKPTYIVVYDPDMSFVREIEVYKAENPEKRLKVYFLFYDDSIEVQKFEASIRRENNAFESLIRQKSLMMIPTDQDGRCLGLNPSVPPEIEVSPNKLTRKAGGRKGLEKPTQVIVDMREFMSSLPCVLHQQGMKIVPVTLEVGDYILSPDICVERKSILDLYSSFSSGRLYNQAEMMTRYYQIPVLLIEFSQDKSFSFHSSEDIGDDIAPNSILSKLSLLVLHFPRLRLVWSRSLHATAEIFSSLKANQDEPDVSKALRVGVPTEDGLIEGDIRAEIYNTSAVELLRRLPGVSDANYRSLIEGCSSLAELALLPLEKLAELMGGQRPAKMLRDFLDAKCPTFL